MMMMDDTDSNLSFVPIKALWLCDHLLQMFEAMRGKRAQELGDGEDKHATQKRLDQELRQAVRARHDSSLSKVWDLCHRGANVLQVDPDDDTTLLHLAARAGNNRIFQYLSICRGAASNHWYKKDRNGDTILHVAAKANNVYLVKWILRNTFFSDSFLCDTDTNNGNTATEYLLACACPPRRQHPSRDRPYDSFLTTAAPSLLLLIVAYWMEWSSKTTWTINHHDWLRNNLVDKKRISKETNGIRVHRLAAICPSDRQSLDKQWSNCTIKSRIQYCVTQINYTPKGF